jgi:hypothetical protein
LGVKEGWRLREKDQLGKKSSSDRSRSRGYRREWKRQQRRIAANRDGQREDEG